MARLVEATEALLRSSGTFADPDPRDYAEDIRALAESLEQLVKKGKGWNEAVVRAYPMTRQTAIAPFTAIVEKDMKSNIDEPERYYPEFIKKLRRLAADAENGKLSGNVRL